MKNIEKLAIVAVVLSIVATLMSRMGNFLMFKLSRAGWSLTQMTLLSLPYVVVTLSINIAIAIWLYRVATQDKTKPWVWLLFGLVFGVSGAILYFVFRIYEMKKKETANHGLESTGAPPAAGTPETHP